MPLKLRAGASLQQCHQRDEPAQTPGRAAPDADQSASAGKLKL
jgi:hypothetical protein